MKEERQKLLAWYQKNARPLPWRQTKDPYKIWISEIMLQQTRAQAVIPYYQNFLNKFPDLASLAAAPETEVLAAWTGLGYYSRARNLHRAAKLLLDSGFPQSYRELLAYPGLGEYTSRAISSFAFGEAVGVLDGNVIRFVSRYHGYAVESWSRFGKQALQELADHWATEQAAQVNQALMEMGANICLPQKPHCGICPLQESCVALQYGWVNDLPLRRQKRATELWSIEFFLILADNKILLTKKHDLPILKGQFLPPAKSLRIAQKPKEKPSFQHSVTHHQMFIHKRLIDDTNDPMSFLSSSLGLTEKDILWVEKSQWKTYCQSSLLEKLFR